MHTITMPCKILNDRLQVKVMRIQTETNKDTHGKTICDMVRCAMCTGCPLHKYANFENRITSLKNNIF